MSISREIANYEKGLNVGRCDFILDNNERKFSPLNSASPYFGSLIPGKSLRVLASYDASSYYLFQGYVDSYKIDPKFGNQTAVIQASDIVKILKNQTISMPIKVDINAGSLFTDVLTYATIPPSLRTIDQFTDTIAFAWFEDRYPTSALNDILTYGYYKTYVSGDGDFHIKNRFSNIYGTTVGSYNEFYSLDYSLYEEDMGNRIRVSSTPKEMSSQINTIAWLTDLITVPKSSHVGFWLTYVDPDTLETNTPANNVITPVPSLDYRANADRLGLSTDLTSKLTISIGKFATTAVCTVTNGSNIDAYITKFQLRGNSVQTKPTLSYETEDATSQANYGVIDYEIESNLINTYDHVRNYAILLKESHKDPEDRVTVGLKNQWPDILNNELEDLISVVESNTALSHSFYIDSLDHDIAFERGVEHTVTYGLKKWESYDILVVDSPTQGILGRKLGY